MVAEFRSYVFRPCYVSPGTSTNPYSVNNSREQPIMAIMDQNYNPPFDL